MCKYLYQELWSYYYILVSCKQFPNEFHYNVQDWITNGVANNQIKIMWECYNDSITLSSQHSLFRKQRQNFKKLNFILYLLTKRFGK